MLFLRLFALLSTALTLLPSAAHLLELPGKIGLDQAAYFTVQQIYAGWSLFGMAYLLALLGNLGLAFAERRAARGRSRWALAAALLVALSLAVFFVWVQPANVATQNWTIQPDNWESLRRNWEYGHAACAAIISLAFLSCCCATVRSGPHGSGGEAD